MVLMRSRIDGDLILTIIGGIYLEILEKGLITSMIINKSNNWLMWFPEFDVNYSKKGIIYVQSLVSNN